MLCADWFIHQLHQACEGASLRGSRVISAEDILFLMRRDKVNKTHTEQTHTHTLDTQYIQYRIFIDFHVIVSWPEESGEAVEISPV